MRSSIPKPSVFRRCHAGYGCPLPPAGEPPLPTMRTSQSVNTRLRKCASNVFVDACGTKAHVLCRPVLSFQTATKAWFCRHASYRPHVSHNQELLSQVQAMPADFTPRHITS